MVMIAHQNPRINKPSGLFASFTKSLNEHPPTLVASDNALSAVTSCHDMVNRSPKLDSDLSPHPFNSLIYRKAGREPEGRRLLSFWEMVLA
jgi:hypothetical protein